MRFVIAATLLLTAASPATARYVANTFGVEGVYRIFEFDRHGHPVRPVSGSDLLGAAWPSAIKQGSVTYVYGSQLTSAGWKDIRRWRSVNGAAYMDDGVVFSSDGSEPYGIGPATVTYDGTTWRLFYLIRGMSGPGPSVALATSSNGTNFTRQGVIYTHAGDGGGLSVSYACTDGTRSYLFLHAYDASLSSGDSILVQSSLPDGDYTYNGVILSPALNAGTISGSAGDRLGRFTGSMIEGQAIVIDAGDPEVYIVKNISGNTADLDLPLESSFADARFKSVNGAKVDLSFVQRDGDAWRGAATGYGHFPGKVSEYTFPITSDSISGPWDVGSGFFINPHFGSGKDSAENPEPVRANSDC